MRQYYRVHTYSFLIITTVTEIWKFEISYSVFGMMVSDVLFESFFNVFSITFYHILLVIVLSNSNVFHCLAIKAAAVTEAYHCVNCIAFLLDNKKYIFIHSKVYIGHVKL